ncbi:replication initiator protein A [Streptococcus constellatus subsp. pharyngis]|uniref:Replication initiator A N-terminal domain-containing protein n=1 Tax=Streptococcus constellatus subsp. pharyngis SK1060 = CCUG 46377 TaxID=1035184 RepID=U2YAK0_STRCV|nr:replication initiator protein A [Streptococcus constellatus]AGU72037.1 hypothetical protein SCRE_0155 [Streptococcus constellatus subsp. pharyngis C232]AGU73793.1 hypothetical protein SCR2_0155 [Streptococcus constellatus subsp. pharyngis C818]AGU79161.1 hypothetical protein SCI_0175 [Streptococcus constellatus subsp. pharyngis C1050]QRP81421.1 replication initiator protein A [Streptococcus constellatus]GAD43777.1 hypothetical protein ANG5_0305 [Streptococcus constellatus subsp. pharyngis S
MAYGRISLEQALNSDNFYQLPKVIIGTKFYSKLKAEAKLLFMLCRDRLSVSLDSTRKGDLRFVDEAGDIFIYYSIEDLAEDLGCGRAKVIKLKKELIKYSLIDEVRQGLNKANRIYVKNVITDIQILNMTFEEAQPLLNPVKSTEVSKSNSTYIKESKTKKNKNKIILSEDEEESPSQNLEEKNQELLSRKVDKATQYDREYIWDLVHEQLLNDNFTESTASYILLNFEDRYQYALSNMKYASSSERIAEYVYNGLLASYNSIIRKQNKGVN